MESKKGQVTIFIIVAILMVAGFAIYFFVVSPIESSSIPSNFQPVYSTFLSCLGDDALLGISLLQTQAGYIYLPDFEPGSEYMPFSSQLSFLGNSIPYWHYVSGNNIPREQVPTKRQMEQQLELFINNKITGCNFDSYYDQGFEVSSVNPVARVQIDDNSVAVNLEMELNVVKDDESMFARTHKVTINSKLGSLYDSALKVYDETRDKMILENYAIDTLRLYAPVDGVNISCSPLIWSADGVFSDLRDGIEANTLALNSKESVDDYFVVDLPVREEVRFVNSKDWPYRVEVTPSEGNLLMVNPVGNQQGLGILGFCYAPYHFVYDLNYPVLVQVYPASGGMDEFFQFPLAVVIENNNPQKSLVASASDDVSVDLCQYKNSPAEIIVIDNEGKSVQADVSYECSDNSCYIGKTSGAFLKGSFPQCVNGFVTARAEGYKDARYLFSSVSQTKLTMTMEKIYDKQIQLKLDGVDYNGNAVIYFTSGDYTQTIVYPDQKVIGLTRGQSDIQVYVYKDSSITLGQSVQEQCVDVPRQGFLGFAGLKEERCFEVEIPEQVVSQVLAGGGKQNYYVLDSELRYSGKLEIDMDELPVPSSVEQLNTNYLLFESNDLEINLV